MELVEITGVGPADAYYGSKDIVGTIMMPLDDIRPSNLRGYPDYMMGHFIVTESQCLTVGREVCFIAVKFRPVRSEYICKTEVECNLKII